MSLQGQWNNLLSTYYVPSAQSIFYFRLTTALAMGTTPTAVLTRTARLYKARIFPELRSWQRHRWESEILSPKPMPSLPLPTLPPSPGDCGQDKAASEGILQQQKRQQQPFSLQVSAVSPLNWGAIYSTGLVWGLKEKPNMLPGTDTRDSHAYKASGTQAWCIPSARLNRGCSGLWSQVACACVPSLPCLYLTVW